MILFRVRAAPDDPGKPIKVTGLPLGTTRNNERLYSLTDPTVDRT